MKLLHLGSCHPLVLVPCGLKIDNEHGVRSGSRNYLATTIVNSEH